MSVDTVRISFDAKSEVKMGNLSRGGKNRTDIQVDDHDFNITDSITPVGVYLPKTKDLSLYMVRSQVTSDCCVDIIEDWWDNKVDPLGKIKKLVVNLDNGPQQNSHRTQFMKRIQDMSNKYDIQIQLAYYPPYHSKYNPVERTFGALEQYWSSEVLDTESKVLGLAKTMTWAGKNPVVSLIEKSYEAGIKVIKSIMNTLNDGFYREEGIEKYSVLVTPQPDTG